MVTETRPETQAVPEPRSGSETEAAALSDDEPLAVPPRDAPAAVVEERPPAQDQQPPPEPPAAAPPAPPSMEETLAKIEAIRLDPSKAIEWTAADEENRNRHIQSIQDANEARRLALEQHAKEVEGLRNAYEQLSAEVGQAIGATLRDAIGSDMELTDVQREALSSRIEKAIANIEEVGARVYLEPQAEAIRQTILATRTANGLPVDVSYRERLNRMPLFATEGGAVNNSLLAEAYQLGMAVGHRQPPQGYRLVREADIEAAVKARVDEELARRAPAPKPTPLSNATGTPPAGNLFASVESVQAASLEELEKALAAVPDAPLVPGGNR